MGKCLRPGYTGKSVVLSHSYRKVNTAKLLSRNDLCDLCLLFVHPLVFNPGGPKGKEEPIFIK
jgi:hypothetical protein